MKPGMLWSWERRKSGARPSGESLKLELIWTGLFCKKVGTDKGGSWLQGIGRKGGGRLRRH